MLTFLYGGKLMRIETYYLVITEFDLSMAEAVHKNSLDDDNRRLYQMKFLKPSKMQHRQSLF